VYRTNAVTRHGEHGNALLSRWPILASQHEDMSDHRLEQRGLLHVELLIHGLPVHVLVVHLGLIRASRVRQLAQLKRFCQREIPKDAPVLVAGDFNDWSALVPNSRLPIGLHAWAESPWPPFHHACRWRNWIMFLHGACKSGQHIGADVDAPGGECRITCRSLPSSTAKAHRGEHHAKTDHDLRCCVGPLSFLMR
jgi:hypothetical protein